MTALGRGRPGAALAIVLGALLLMAMVVAVSAQRALVTSRQAALELARAELLAAASSGEAAALAAPADSACCLFIVPGALIASGEVRAGRARASWTLTGAAAPFVTVDVVAEAGVLGGTARASHRALAVWWSDSAGGPRWVLAGGLGWTRRPSP